MSVVKLRRAPYPYRALVAISDDVDGMTIGRFRSLNRFIRTTKETEFGIGLGLDYADSFWVFSPGLPRQKATARRVALCNGLEVDADTPDIEEIAHYVRCGWIDTLHSLGDFSGAGSHGTYCRREHALRAVRLFYRHGIQVPVWVNHGNEHNVQNVGHKKWMKGGRWESDSYLGDLLNDFGIQFVNIDTGSGDINTKIEPIVTNLNVPLWSFTRSFAEVTSDSSLIKSAFRKTIPAGENEPATIYVWHPHLLARQLNEQRLSEIAARGAFAIFAQHFGFTRGQPFPEAALEALRCLSRFQERGEILVTRTSRLLQYARQRMLVEHNCSYEGGILEIDIRGVRDPVYGLEKPMLHRLRGITFEVTDPARARILIAGRRLPDHEIVRSPPREAFGSIGVAWHESDTTDYTPL